MGLLYAAVIQGAQGTFCLTHLRLLVAVTLNLVSETLSRTVEKAPVDSRGRLSSDDVGTCGCLPKERPRRHRVQVQRADHLIAENNGQGDRSLNAGFHGQGGEVPVTFVGI